MEKSYTLDLADGVIWAFDLPVSMFEHFVKKGCYEHPIALGNEREWRYRSRKHGSASTAVHIFGIVVGVIVCISFSFIPWAILAVLDIHRWKSGKIGKG